MKEGVSELGNPYLEAGRRDKDVRATFWHQATPGTTYWRCLVPARHLNAQSIPFTIRDLSEKKGQPFLKRQKGVAVWQFLGDEHRSRIALGMAQLYGTRTLMEVDDNYLRDAPYLKGKINRPWVSTIAEAVAGEGMGTGYSHERHRHMAQFVDGIICSTENLAEAYSEFNRNVWVCPNSVDPVDWQYEREPHDTFRIVYYGGSSHINTDSPYVTKALKWAAKQPGVEVYTVGMNNPAWSFPHERVPWSDDLASARKHLFRFDLGLAPLNGNRWANGKSDVKALEYAMAGVMPLMSKAEPYRPWFDWDPLVVEKDEWEERVRWAVTNQDAVKLLASEAKAYVMEERTIQANIHKWEEAIDA